MSALSRLKEHPKGFWFIFWGELAERASYYGMRTVLLLYMTQILRFEDNTGAAIMRGFQAACYLAPLFGGFLADRVLGRYKTILYFSVPYILGHVILGVWDARTGLFVALGLLALGSGSIKPNTSTMLGQMYEQQKKEALLTEAFSYFYAAINIGSAITSWALPALRNKIAGFNAGDGEPIPADKMGDLARAYAVTLTVPAVLMVVAFGFFAIGKKHYPADDPKALPPKTLVQKAAERSTLVRISGVFMLIAIFWFVYDASSGTWVNFAKDHMDMHLIGSWSTSADQIQALNPVLIVGLTPVFISLWEIVKARRGGVDLPDTRKMMFGFLIVVVCMAIMSAAGFAAGDGKVSVLWLCLATLVISLAELCISAVGLEFAFRVAAPGTKSVVTAAFWLMVFLGNVIGGFFDEALWGPAKEGHPFGTTPGVFFGIQTIIIAVATVLFWFVARRFEKAEPAPA